MDIYDFFERFFVYIWLTFAIASSVIGLLIAYLIIMVLWRFAFGC